MISFSVKENLSREMRIFSDRMEFQECLCENVNMVEILTLSLETIWHVFLILKWKPFVRYSFFFGYWYVFYPQAGNPMKSSQSNIQGSFFTLFWRVSSDLDSKETYSTVDVITTYFPGWGIHEPKIINIRI